MFKKVVLVSSVFLVACGSGGSGGDDRGWSRLTTNQVESAQDSSTGEQVVGAEVVHEDEFESADSWLDIGRVILGRGSLNDELALAYDAQVNNLNSILPVEDYIFAALYIDTDMDASTGARIGSIGADLMLRSSADDDFQSGAYRYQNQSWLPNGRGSQESYKTVSSDRGLHHLIGFFDTDQVLQSGLSQAVLRLELSNASDSSKVVLDSTAVFSLLGDKAAP